MRCPSTYTQLREGLPKKEFHCVQDVGHLGAHTVWGCEAMWDDVKSCDDHERFDWWEKRINYEHGIDFETGDVILYKVQGNVNDRVWTEVSRGDTLREAIDGARLQIDGSKV